jgi:hypothetical protein
MTQAGVFRIILKDDRFDASLRASELLHERLKKIAQQNTEAKKDYNPLASISDIEQSHIMYINSTYKPYVSVASEYTKVKPKGDGGSYLNSAGGTVQFTFPTYGHFISDMVFHVKFSELGTLNPTASSPYYRYCSLPGLRLFKEVSFKSGEVPVVDYDRDTISLCSKFFVNQSNIDGWARAHGQQTIRSASFFNPAGFTGIMQYAEGLQTPKTYHPATDLWVPLQFDFCTDVSKALSNDLITNTQRVITAEIEKISKLIQASDINGNEISLPISQLQIDINLYVNNLFVNPEIHQIIASRIGWSLIRVHRKQSNRVIKSSDSILLNQMKYPIEYLIFGFRNAANLDDFDKWYLMGTSKTRTLSTSLMQPIAFWNSTVGECEISCRTGKEISSLENMVDLGLSLTSQGVELYKQLPLSFYSNYLPLRYSSSGKVMIKSPTDECVGIMPECLYPGQSQPSGYYPASAGRELYMNYNSTIISASIPTDYVIVGMALNFLVRKGDSISLRFST